MPGNRLVSVVRSLAGGYPAAGRAPTAIGMVIVQSAQSLHRSQPDGSSDGLPERSEEPDWGICPS